MTKIETKHIRTDGGTQARAGLNNEKVNEYKELLHESGGEWPFKDPIVVFYDGTDYWLADGFHRFHACWTGGRYVVEADVRQGTRREAQLHAVGANADHGLPRTADDKRRAVTLLLEDAEWGRWSDREIARQCRVSPTFVGNLRKELGTVHVDSERVYTRNGEERVMDTANIGTDPRPEITAVPEREQIVQNVGRELVMAVRETYSADLIMSGKCKRPFEYNGELYICTGGYGSGPHSKNDEEVAWAVRVVPEADFEFRPITYSESNRRPERASYYGVKVKSGQDAYVFVYPELRFVSTKNSPFYVGPMAQGPEVREALDRYLDQWPVNRAFITMRLANAESSGHEKEMSDAVAALGASDSAIYHQAMVLRNRLPGPSWERGKGVAKTAVANEWKDAPETVANIREEIMVWYIGQRTNDIRGQYELMKDIQRETASHPLWGEMVKRLPESGNLVDLLTAIDHLVNYLQGRVDELVEETAVSAPDLMTDIMADVDAYEAEAAQLFAAAPAPRRAAYTDTRLANLNTALDLVTRLTADTSLTVDIVGPLARALGLMEDAKRALTKRQQYIAWLRDYQDDDGRRWTDLSDNQTWHKNSPCYQAFVSAFPGEDFVKSALMDAKTQLEKETAVVQEVSA